MARPWTAEVEVSPSLARALLEAQFPELRPSVIERLGAGWDNVAYLVDGALVFRFPRRHEGLLCMQNERLVMPGVSAMVPLPITAPTHVGHPSDLYPWPFAGYPLVKGTPSIEAQLTHAQRLASAPVLAGFLSALHSIDAEAATELGASTDRIGKLDLDRRLPKTRVYLDRLTELRLIDTPDPWNGLLDTFTDLRAPRSACLIHGDFGARHVLVNEVGLPCGVIDWGDVHLGDPAVDLAIVWAFLPPEARPLFQAAYTGPADPDTWVLARFRAIYMACVLALYGHETGDEVLMRSAVAELHRAGLTPTSAERGR